MKYKKFRQILAAALAAALLAGCGTPASDNGQSQNAASEASKSSAKTGSATVGELADYFVKAADGYNASVNREEILEGLKVSGKATRIEMLVIAARAFGELPEPGAYAKLTAASAPDMSDVPKWAGGSLQNMASKGLLAASDLEAGDKKDTASIKEAAAIAARFYAFYGNNLKDDFYTSVNQQQLNTLPIPKGQESAGGSASVSANTDKELKDLITELINNKKEYAKGSIEQKIRDLYETCEDRETRDKEGIKPLKKYLDAVDKADSFSELNAAIARAVDELGMYANGLFLSIPTTDLTDSTIKVLQLMTPASELPEEEYDDPDGKAYKKHKDDLTEKLTAVGEKKEDAERHAENIMKFEKSLAAHMSEQDDSGEIKEQKYYTPESLDKMMPHAEIGVFLSAVGLRSDVKMLVFDEKQFEEYTKWFKDKNLELFKSLEKIALLEGFSSFLSSDLAEKFGYTGVESGDTAVQSYLPEELGKLYTDRYFNADSKAEIEKMVHMMIDTFKDRVTRLDWMSDETKKEALKKLDSLTVLIGYPDKWEFSNARIRGLEEGGTYFENAAACEAAKHKRQMEELNQPADPRRFALSAFMVNAAANRNTNTLIFPAGILQAPFYDRNASFEQNLGAIGSTIAHEITHIFDDGGAQYDSRGNLNDWWNKKDYSHFKNLCKKAEEFYNGREVVPGAGADGRENLSENIADIGGIACTLEILSKMKDPDYDAFFRSYANQWVKVADYSTLAESTETDTHAPNKLRCNLVLTNFQEFYDTYGISEGDGMYTAPEERIQIW